MELDLLHCMAGRLGDSRRIEGMAPFNSVKIKQPLEDKLSAQDKSRNHQKSTSKIELGIITITDFKHQDY